MLSIDLSSLFIHIKRTGRTDMCAYRKLIILDKFYVEWVMKILRRLYFGNFIAIAFVALICTVTGQTSENSAGSSIISSSRQFIVHDARQTQGVPALRNSEQDPRTIDLEPALLAVSAERIKGKLLELLRSPDNWRSRIHLKLFPTQSEQQPILINSIRYRDNWEYRVNIPDQVQTNKLITGLVEVLLKEIANRRALRRSSEIPLWLTEGISLQLQYSTKNNLLLKSETYTIDTTTDKDPLIPARQILDKNIPMTFDQLSMPGPNILEEQVHEVFSHTAQIFTWELLNLPGGRAKMMEFLMRLPEKYNWQLAFLEAFNEDFKSLIDIEKWWALSIVNFRDRDSWRTSPTIHSFKRLDEILSIPAKVRSEKAAGPVRTQLPIQAALELADPNRRNRIFQTKINQLLPLRYSVPTELVPLIDNYRIALMNYLDEMSELGVDPIGKSVVPSTPSLVASQLKRRLNKLDNRREELKKKLHVKSESETSGIPSSVKGENQEPSSDTQPRGTEE